MELLLRMCAYSLICLGGVVGLHVVIVLPGDAFVWIWLTFTGVVTLTDWLVHPPMPPVAKPLNIFDYFEEPSE